MKNMMHLNASCPRCMSGIMTPHSVDREVRGIINRNLISDTYIPKIGDMIVSTCTLEECGYTEILATPQTLTNAKILMRQRLNSH
jgi:hypothetical protein